MKKVALLPVVLLWLGPAAPRLSPQSFELRDATPGQEITTMVSPGLELRLKGPGASDGSRAVAPAGAFILNPFPYGFRDVRPPTAPGGVRAVAVSDTQILVTFEAARDNVRVIGYDVYRDGAWIGSTETEAYSDSGLLPMSTYGYRATARDRSANVSGSSATAYATTLDSTTAAMPPQFVVEPYPTAIGDTQAVICFRASKPVDARIDYGPNSGYGSSQLVAGSAEYVVSLAGLAPGGMYHYRVVLDPGGADVASADAVLVTLSVADTTDPVFLQQPYVSYVSSTAALVSWRTDEEVLGVVELGVSGPGELSVAEQVYAIDHCVTLAGLVPGSVYYFRVAITDRYGNGPVWSQPDAFVTLATADNSPPFITRGPDVTYLSDDRALVAWATNEPSDSRVWFGTAAGVYDRFMSDETFAVDHQVELVNLLPGTVYYYLARSADTSGNLSAAGVERSFRTPVRPDTRPPRISRLTVTAASRQAVVSWSTSSAADSFVAYGTSPGEYRYQRVDPALASDHEIVLTGLEPGRAYYCQVSSQDPAGNRATSGELPFETLPEGAAGPPVISGISLRSTQVRIEVRWATSSPATSELLYRRADETAWTPVERAQLATDHVVRLFPRLLGSGTYYYRVASTDDYGQTAEASLDDSGQPLRFVVP